MTVTVVQSQNIESLRNFERSDLFQQMFGDHEPRTTWHYLPGTEQHREEDGGDSDRGEDVYFEPHDDITYCLMIEDNNVNDDATFSWDGKDLKFITAEVRNAGIRNISNSLLNPAKPKRTSPK